MLFKLLFVLNKNRWIVLIEAFIVFRKKVFYAFLREKTDENDEERTENFDECDEGMNK